MENFNMYNPVDKAVINSYNNALDTAADWFTSYLGEGHTIEDWVKTGIGKFFNELLEE